MTVEERIDDFLKSDPFNKRLTQAEATDIAKHIGTCGSCADRFGQSEVHFEILLEYTRPLEEKPGEIPYSIKVEQAAYVELSVFSRALLERYPTLDVDSPPIPDDRHDEIASMPRQWSVSQQRGVLAVSESVLATRSCISNTMSGKGWLSREGFISTDAKKFGPPYFGGRIATYCGVDSPVGLTFWNGIVSTWISAGVGLPGLHKGDEMENGFPISLITDHRYRTTGI
jgi:hypothetical protein